MGGPRQYRTVSQGVLRALAALAVLGWVLSAAAAFISVRAVQGEVSSRASVVQLCQAGNESRAQQVKLWSHLAAISVPPPHETPAARERREAAVTALLRYVRQVFAPRDCNHLNAR